MHGTRRVVIVGAILALSSLTACGTTVRVNGAEVDSKVAFLSVLEQAWRDGPAKDKHAQLAAKTSCWLLREPDSGAIQPRALCGPIRHLKDQGKPGVFDELEFEPQLVGDGEVTVDPDSIDFEGTGVEPPPELELYHPDGAEPVAPDQVPEPPAPKAEPGIVAVGDDGQIADAPSPKDGTIVAPGRKVEVTRFAAVPTLPGADGIPFYQPADNEEFLALTISIEPEEGYDEGSVDTSATYSVRSEGKTTDLAQFFDVKGSWGSEKADSATIVVSVPKGKDAELVVGVAGLDQTISVRTGERTSTTAVAYYRGETTFGVNKQFATQTAKNGDFRYQHGVTFTQASVSAFDRSKGWAPEGQMWLYLAWDNETSQRTGAKDFHYDDPTFDLAKSMQIAADGNAAKIISGIPVADKSYSSNRAVLAQVPAAAKAIKVTYAPQGTFAADSYGGTVEDLKPKSGSFAFEPLSFEVSLS